MNILALDFETYFDDDYTLQKLTTEHYVRDARFEALGCGFQLNGGPKVWVNGPAVARALKQYDWSQYAVLMHHAHFDGLILSHHYGIKPKFILDTLSMARLQLGNHLSVGLESLARHYGLQGKTVPYDRMRGRRWADMDTDLRATLAEGCLHDVALTWDIFNRLGVGFPQEEYQVIDMTVRMFTEPQLEGDIDVFAKVWTYEAERKKQLLAELGVTSEDLQSALRFTQLLLDEGVEPETKQGKNGLIPAFAKTDDFMVGLLEHGDERIRTLAEARLGLKSTLDQTRAERLGFMATRGPMPVYLSYCAAHTTRWGGADKVNWQNFKRGSMLRKGARAPSGRKIVKADKAQIECRILNYVAEQWDVIERFAVGHDPYVGIASKFYGRDITKTDAAERGVGKQLELSCGYGSGADTIVRTAKRGTYGPPVMLSAEQGLAARDLYRSTHPNVVAYWKQASRIISALAGTNTSIQWGPLTAETNKITCQGIPIWYPELHFYEPSTDENALTTLTTLATMPEQMREEIRDYDQRGYWRYKTRKGWAKLYGGKLVENVVQFMSRVDMSQSLLRILARTGIRPAQLEHDAAVWVVPEKLVDPFVKVVTVEMTRSPDWLPGIPLGADVSVSETM
jgi:DNA polymerase